MKEKKNNGPGFFHRILSSFRSRLRNLLEIFTPGRDAVRGAALGIILIAVVLMFMTAFPYLPLIGMPIVLLQVLYFFGLPLGITLGVAIVLAVVTRIPAFYRWMLLAGIFFILHLFHVPMKGKLVIVVAFVLFSSFFGAAAWLFLRRKWFYLVRAKRVLTIVSLVAGLGGLLAGFYFLLNPGGSSELPRVASMRSDILPPTLSLQDPSLPGRYKVLSLSYGSGKDLHRPAYGAGAVLITDSVDGSPFISNWKKFHGRAREKYWGFNQSALPLNARVWYPDGPGPFPLVLVVHGNHLDRDYSDPGYGYLGELMASRGFIFASVDQNFINGTWSDVFGRLKEENDARAWLLLKHLECWKSWNRKEGNPFFGKVDMDRIALVGHSRGGEAVNIAACFNKLPHYPDDATVPFDFNFKIRSVIPIAPVDGQYRPADEPTFYENVNYFVLHGSHDMDMRSYHGARQFHRVHFTDTLYHVRSGLYVYGANHGQFNTVWGRNDVGYPDIYLFNRKNIMPAVDQQKIASVYISAFLEMTLLDKWDYLPLFTDARVGRDWLPQTVYLNQFEDSRTGWICSFEEDLDLSTGTMPGVQISTGNLTVWKERKVPLKWGSQDTRGVYLGWNTGATDTLRGWFSLECTDSLFSENDALVFSLADAGEDSNPERSWLKKETVDPEGKNVSDTLAHAGQKPKTEKKKKEEQPEPVDYTIVLTDRAGQSASLPLSHFSALQPQPGPELMKLSIFTDVPKSEIVFQTFVFPIRDFMGVNPLLSPEKMKTISFVFDRSGEGVVVVDNIGVRPAIKKSK